MNKKLKKASNYIIAVLLSIGTSLSLYSCNDDIMNEPNTPNGTNTNTTTNGKDIETISIPVDMSAGIEEQDTRVLNLKLVDRGNNYTDEFSPKLNGATSIENISFVLVKANDDKAEFIKTVYTQDVTFNYNTNPDGTKDPKRLYYTGELKFPANYDFTEGDWYIMGIMNYNGGEYNNGNKASYLTFGKSGTANTSTTIDTDERLNYSSSAVMNASDGNSINMFSMPYISQWVKLEIKTRGDGNNLKFAEIKGLQFRPQGVLLQYDFGNNIFTEIDMRRQAVVSNSLSFSGRYDLSGDKIFNAFSTRNQSSGIGIPEWVEDQATMSGYKLYKYKGDNPLRIGEAFYPWDTPMPSNNLTPTATESWKNENLVEIATDGDAHGVITIPYYKEGTQKWRFRTNNSSRKIMYIWGMPKKVQPQNAYTYFMTSIYDTNVENDNFSNSIEPFKLSNGIVDYKNYETAKKKVDDINVRIAEYEQKINEYKNAPTSETEEAKKQREKNLELYTLYKESALKNKIILEQNLKSAEDEIVKDKVPAYSPEIKAEYEKQIESYYTTLRKQAIQQVTDRTQPLVVLHQTNHRFTEADNGKVKHIQTLIQTDLMISEVAYKKVSDSEIYSFLEIYNPTTDYIDLSNYAIARLIPNSSNNPTHLSYRKADGTPTDNLQEALILPLSALDPENTDPFKVGSGWENWQGEKGQYDIRDTNMPNYPYTSPTLYPKSDRWNCLEYYPTESSKYNDMIRKNYPGKTDFYSWRFKDDDGKMYLSSGRTILLGGNSFMDKVRLSRYTTKIEWDRVDPSIKYKQGNDNFRCAIAYRDGIRNTTDSSLGEGTLDMHPGDGFVLIKKNPFNDNSWQIIDASAPIGTKNLAHDMDYNTFKDKFNNKDAFSYRRTSNIKYPNIYPFRTNVTNSWEDDINIDNQTLGVGNDPYIKGYHKKTLDWDWKRTPLDPNFYTEYKNRIPTM